MSLRIHNTLTDEKEEFIPLKQGRVGMYVCGPTVYDVPHIGHARSAYVFDVIRRYLEYRGFKVKFVRNVTDVDDKIIEKAREDCGLRIACPERSRGADCGIKEKTKEIAEKYLKEYHDAMALLGIRPPDKEPKASEYINKMQAFIKILIERGAAYQAGGDVYFDVKKAKGYGKLSNQSLGRMEAGARVSAEENKKDPLDFALWKKAKPNEPSWKSPWGEGRPGWHIECSVMSSDILGGEFDIHGGGRDLIFPHHENEIAQSESAGKAFAKYWLHHGLLTINGRKMAKSLGNFVTVRDFTDNYGADAIKLFFLASHYSQPVDFTWETIKEKHKALRRLTTFLKDAKKRQQKKEFLVKTDFKNKISPEELRRRIEERREDVIKSMDDDFNAPNAVAVLFEIVRTCNKILYDAGCTEKHLAALKYAAETVEEFADVFGLSLQDTKEEKSDTWVTIAIAQREQLRKEKKYKEADEVRKMLDSKGIILEDTKEGTTWRRKL